MIVNGSVMPILRIQSSLSAQHCCARRALPFARGLLIACIVGLLSGCSGEAGPVCHPVRGRVTLDSKPLAEATVVFHPLDALLQSAPKPLAYTDADGRYALTTFRRTDGAQAGQYTITIELRAPRQVGEELVRDGRNLLPARYAGPETSGLRYEVIVGENAVPPLALTSR